MSQAIAVEHDVDMTGDCEPIVRAYIVVDTNILLECLPTVQALFRILCLPKLRSMMQILIPLTVLYELDNHHKYGNEQVRHRAREANRFLNRTIRARKHDPRMPLRVQKLGEMSEHVRANSTKRDDQHILDCCLNFRAICQEMWLWTNDQIFGTIAESNDIPVIDKCDLYGVTLAIGINDDSVVCESVKIHQSRTHSEPTREEDTGMEVDEDLYFDLPALANEQSKLAGIELASGPDGTRSLLDDYNARYSSTRPTMPIGPFSSQSASLEHGSGFSTPTSLPAISRPGSTRPGKLSVYDIHDQLETLLQPLLTYLAVTSTRSDRYLHSLLDRLIQTESLLFPNTPERTAVTDAQQQLLVVIDATRTLVRYCERDMYEKGVRPRVGEVVEAIESLGEMCLSVGLGDDVRMGCVRLATTVRAN